MPKRDLPAAILQCLGERRSSGLGGVGAAALVAQVRAPRPTVNRYLARLVTEGRLIRAGSGPATIYELPSGTRTPAAAAAQQTDEAEDNVRATVSPSWSARARALSAELQAPLATRAPVTYRRQFVDDYRPNQSRLLPHALADALFTEGRMKGQQPAGTYARKVLEQLLIDLSWHSSRLEGNRKSLLDTRKLFSRGRSAADDLDATMLLNHKDAIEFIVDAVPTYGITVPVVRNVHSLLMQGLLANTDSLGAIRRTVVNIADTVYVPTQVPSLLEEMLDRIVEKARNINNSIEATFFLWVNLAYLQPFEDGNKRTSRLSANLPLMLSNCAPVSFLDVGQQDYASAMLGVYERLDPTLAVELFEWTYRRSIPRYQAIVEAMGAPDPFRMKYREHLGEAVRRIVSDAVPLSAAIGELGITAADNAEFEAMVRDELRHLEAHNCARYRLSIGKTEEWIARGRPVHDVP